MVVEGKPPTCYVCKRKGHIRKRCALYISSDDVTDEVRQEILVATTN